ncbi:MAG: glycerol-3-phosphate dehydrogenase/oxidase, partial [Deltaproteobacteria bacterium]|nr:glycerol-3-phosphate dehydrogenase/oxidase [Deltaproteobacteria bacterium]
MEFSYLQRQGIIRRLKDEKFDILIIGGGITGAGTLREAAMRGLKTALIEKEDFAYGTSSRSSKLIHGGLRYLEQKDFSLVFESTQERALLMKKLASHLVKPVPFILPVYKNERHSPLKLSLGLWLYDILGLFRTYKLHKRLSASRLSLLEPGINGEGLRGGFLYYDCLTDDARLTFETALSGFRHGGLPANYIEFIRPVRNGSGKFCGAVVLDRITGEVFTIKSSFLVSAAGPWTDETASRLSGKECSLLRVTKGVHFTVVSDILPVKHAFVMTSPVDGRTMFAIPWHGLTIIGTTDTDYSGSPDNVAADRTDIEYLLASVKKYFPGAAISSSDIISTWAGLRPLVREDRIEESQVSREHHIWIYPENYALIAGGKLTTFRIMARELIDYILPALFPGKKVPASGAGTVPLPYFQGSPSKDEYLNEKEVLVSRYGLAPESADHLIGTYGGRVSKFMHYLDGDRSLGKRICDSLPYIRCEILHAVRHEMTMNVSDFLMRRTQMCLRMRDNGAAIAETVSGEIQKYYQDYKEISNKELDKYLTNIR